MIRLYDNAFSPFARKVRMVLGFKGLAYESIDALALDELEGLGTVNPRREVPVLEDGPVTVVESSDIVAYLEHRYPEPRIHPDDPPTRVIARAWERTADRVLDAIVHDVSLWVWPTHQRQDLPPDGLLDAARADLGTILGRVETSLQGHDFVASDRVTIADLALFPHLGSLRLLGLEPDEADHARTCAWIRRMRGLPFVREDLERIKTRALEAFSDPSSPYEGAKVVWRGDRIEWLLHHGFDAWWRAEREAGRAVVPAPL